MKDETLAASLVASTISGTFGKEESVVAKKEVKTSTAVVIIAIIVIIVIAVGFFVLKGGGKKEAGMQKSGSELGPGVLPPEPGKAIGMKTPMGGGGGAPTQGAPGAGSQ